MIDERIFVTPKRMIRALYESCAKAKGHAFTYVPHFPLSTSQVRVRALELLDEFCGFRLRISRLRVWGRRLRA